MAKQNNGINGGYSGAVGTVIGYNLRGQWYMRARPRLVRNPGTSRQQSARGLLGSMSRLSSAMSQALRVGLRAEAVMRGMTERNLFMHLNRPCFSQDGQGEWVVDYAGLCISKGVLPGLEFGTVSVGPSGILAAPFATAAAAGRASGDDEVRLYAFCPSLAEGRLSIPAWRRSQCVTLQLPDSWQGCRVYVYGFACSHPCVASASSLVWDGMV